MAANTNSIAATVTTNPMDSNGYVVSVTGGLTATAGQCTTTSANTPYQLSATSVPCKGVMISPSATGTVAIYIGTSSAGLSATPIVGIYLAANTPPQYYQVSDVSLLWVRSASAGDSVGWLAFN